MNNELINNLFNKEKKKVELVFENSNTILTGGLDKEDDKLNIEIFLDKDNDKDKINNLLSPKNIVNQYNYDKNGVSNIDTYDNNNLLIKGNNLVVLHTLKQKFTNKIDVIYIDPPYYFNKTKSSNSFAYNSNFELSTWLVFMKNRLEIAKELLSDEGVIFISMNEDGTSHLKLLCDDIFGVDNFIGNIVWKKKTRKGVPPKDNFINVKESILVYKRKEFRFFGEKRIMLENEFSNPDNHPNGLWRNTNIKSTTSKKRFIIKDPNTNKEYIDTWAHSEKEINRMIDNNELIFPKNNNKQIRKKEFLINLNLNLPIQDYIGFYDGQKNKLLLKKIFNENIFQYAKPIELIKYLISISFKKENIVILDFFAGSSTTGHAVMDLNKEDGGNRKFILVEQMDYIETISSERLKRCIKKYDYDESFIYCELEESNIKELKRKIKSVNSKEELIDLIELNFSNKKDEIYSYINLIEQIAPKKANKLYEMIRMLFLYYIPLDEDYVSFNGNNTFSNSLLTINK